MHAQKAVAAQKAAAFAQKAAAAAEEARRARDGGRWHADKASLSACQRCSAKFGLTRRRHHCRKCGKVMCKACLPTERALGAECGGGFATPRESNPSGRVGSIAAAVLVCVDCSGVRLPLIPRVAAKYARAGRREGLAGLRPPLIGIACAVRVTSLAPDRVLVSVRSALPST